MRPRLLPLAFLLLTLFPTGAGAVKRDVVHRLQEEYGEHTYQLRVDLQGTNYLSEANVISEQGLRHSGRAFPVLFRQLETVYLDRIANEGEHRVSLTVYRSAKEAHQIRGAVPGAPFPVGPDMSTTVGSFARGISTIVLIDVKAGKAEPDAQIDQVRALMNTLFYLKQTPSYEEKEAFIIAHSELPIPKLMEVTGLAEEIVRGILKRGAEPQTQTQK